MEMNYRIWDVWLGSMSGFSAHLIRLLGEIHKLEQQYQVHTKGLPIWIDWTKWPDPSHEDSTNYYEGDKMPFVNAWDYYFINPVDTNWALHSIEENPESWISSDGAYNFSIPNGVGIWNRRDWTPILSEYVSKYFKPKQDILDSLDKHVTRYKTLGVHCRRSDMDRAHNHSRLNFTNEEYFKYVMLVFKQYGFEKIYLATEEIAIHDYFMSRIPELILTQHDCFRVKTDDSPVRSLQTYPRPLHRYLMGKEILIDILNLSRCYSLICSVSGVSNIAITFNGLKYDDVYYFNMVKINNPDI